MMEGRINIYQMKEVGGTLRETVIYRTYLSSESVHEEEMSISNLIRLSFDGERNITLPAGAYIKHGGVKYRLLSAYQPKAGNNRSYKYTPEFQHPVMLLSRIPYFHLDGNTSGDTDGQPPTPAEVWRTATKESEWSFSGYAATLVNDVVTYMNLYLGMIDSTLASELGAGWDYVCDSFGQKVVEISVQASDIISVVSQAAEQCGCEFHFDAVQKMLFFGDVANQMTETPFVLKSGYNVSHASVTSNSEEYYNRYVVRGGTTNLSQPTYAGGNARVTKRLTLPDSYIDSILDLRGNENVPEYIRSDANEPALTGQITMDDVYPHLRVYIYEPRERRCYKLDEDGNELTDQIYSKWYVRLAYRSTEAEYDTQDQPLYIAQETVEGTTYYWYPYVITDRMRIQDTDLQISFLPNYDSDSYSCPLVGRTFVIVPFYDDTQENEHNENHVPFDVYAGEYRIDFEEDNGLIIPTGEEGGLYPQGASTPSHENNIVSVIGVVVTEELKTEAKYELLQAAIEYVGQQRKDRKTYSFDSYVRHFRHYRQNPNFRLYVGQKVIYDDGGDLIGGTSMRLETKIRKLVTRLTDPDNIKIEVGNERIVGRRESYEKKVETLITYIGGGGGTISDATFIKLLTTYGRRLFLSKAEDDSAAGEITFLKESHHGQGASFGSSIDLWGYVRSVAGVGMAWFRNLVSTNFETAIAKVTNYLTGNNGLKIRDDVTIAKGTDGMGDATLSVANIQSKNISNSDTVTTHNLVVTGLAHFFELVIDKIRAAGGALILTPAEGFVVVDIEATEVPFPQDPDNMTGATLEGKKLYFKASDRNGRSISQSWRSGDQAICMNFNSVETMMDGDVAHDISNKYYWTVVYGVSGTTVNRTINGETVECHWIAIYSAVSGDGIPDGVPTTGGLNPIPCDGTGGRNGCPLWDGDPSSAAVGDEISMLGSRVSAEVGDSNYSADAKERKTAIYMSSYSALDAQMKAPFLAFYQGIEDFNLQSHRKTYMDADGSKFFGEFHALSSTGNGDDLNALIGRILSDDIISGGDAKVQLRQRWEQMVSDYTKILGQFNDLGLDGEISDENYRPNYSYQNALDEASNVFYELHVFLDGDYSLERQHTLAAIPSWIDDANLSSSTDLADAGLIAGWNGYAEEAEIVITATDTLTPVHNQLWKLMYNAINELRRAVTAYQNQSISSIGSDNIISSKEKALLRQMFAGEITEYFELKSELEAFGEIIYKQVEGLPVPVVINGLRTAINALGTYLNNSEPWKVEREQGDAQGVVYWTTYPRWIDAENSVSSTAITSEDFDEAWSDVFEARQVLIADIANARQNKIDNITASVEVPQKYIQLNDPLTDPNITNVKEGDYWYKPVTLTDPTTGEQVQGDFYNEYICQGSGDNKQWLLLNAAQAALLNIASDIYMSVFGTSGSSSIVQRLNAIVQTVNGMKIGARNLIINSDFAERTDNVPNHFSSFRNAVFSFNGNDAPTQFSESLEVGVEEAGGGLALPSSSSYQPYLRLEAGQDYMLSFYIKIAGNESEATIQVRRGNSADAVVIAGGNVEIGTSWQRLSFDITGDGNAYPLYITKQAAGTFRITGLQLENGNIMTAWRKAEEDWQGIIDLLTDKIDLSVTKDGLRQAGIGINGNNQSVTIYGRKTKVEGDLDIQGLTTENVTVADWFTPYPIVVNMGMFYDETDEHNVTVKSVQIKARNEALNGSNNGTPPLVVLPFYDSSVEGNGQNNWRVNKNTYVNFQLTSIDGVTSYTFPLFSAQGYADSQTRIIAYKRNGTRLTIINEADPYTANWQSLINAQSVNRQYIDMLIGNAVIVCADPRIIIGENLADEIAGKEQLIPNNTEEDWIWNGGKFSCGGYEARFIAVLPGQSLQLRSQIMTIDKDNNTQEVLIWVVENSSEYVPMTKGLSCEGIVIYEDGISPTFDPTQSHRGVEDCWMGNPVLNLAGNNNFLNLAINRG